MALTTEDITVIRALLGVAREQQAPRRKVMHPGPRVASRIWQVGDLDVILGHNRHNYLAVRRRGGHVRIDHSVASAQQVADLLHAVGLVPVELTSGYRAAQDELANGDKVEKLHAELDEAYTNAVADRLIWDEIAGSIWLHAKWRWFTKQLTTEQKEVLADAVDRWGSCVGDEWEPIERWWRDDAPATRQDAS